MKTAESSTGKPVAFDPSRISRPDPALMRYYLVVALLTGPGFPITIVPLAFKYMTLRYAFEEDGISMRWGVLFRREIHLTYRRIQDIHLTRGLIQRWMGLATVAIQTASGSAGPEMSIEGILEAAELRDYLYSRMRGARGDDEAADASLAGSGVSPDTTGDEVLRTLHEIRDALRQLASQRGADNE
jgi:putative membrane protein